MDLCENVVKGFEMHNSLKANKHISRRPVRDATCSKQMASLHKFILILSCSSTSDSFNIRGFMVLEMSRLQSIWAWHAPLFRTNMFLRPSSATHYSGCEENKSNSSLVIKKTNSKPDRAPPGYTWWRCCSGLHPPHLAASATCPRCSSLLVLAYLFTKTQQDSLIGLKYDHIRMWAAHPSIISTCRAFVYYKCSTSGNDKTWRINVQWHFQSFLSYVEGKESKFWYNSFTVLMKPSTLGWLTITYRGSTSTHFGLSAMLANKHLSCWKLNKANLLVSLTQSFIDIYLFANLFPHTKFLSFLKCPK